MIQISNFIICLSLIFLFLSMMSILNSLMEITKSRYTRSTVKKYNTPALQQKRYSYKLSKKNFKDKLKNRGWYTNKSYLNSIYSKYKTNEDFRICLNKYFYQGKKILKENMKELKSFFQEIVENGENFIIEIIGIIRSGKSRVARSLIKFFCNIIKHNMKYHMDIRNPDEFKIFATRENKFDKDNAIYVTYNFSQSQFVIKGMQKLQICFQDEMPSDEGEGSKKIKQQITNVLKIASGKKRLNFIFLNPYLIILKNVHWYIQILGINKAKKKTLAIYSSIGEKGKMEYVGVIVFNVDEIEELTNYYEIKSDEIKDEIKDQGGVSQVEWFTRDSDIELFKNEVLKVNKKNWTLGALKSFAQTNKKIKKNINTIFLIHVINHIYSQIKNATLRPKQYNIIANLEKLDIKIDGDFDPDESKILDFYPIEKDDDIRNIAIYREFLRIKDDPYIRAKQEWMEDNFKPPIGKMPTQPQISRILGHIEGWLKDYIGRVLYESHLKRQLEAKFEGKFKEIENAGLEGHEKPDIRIDFKNNDIWIYSVKCHKPKPKRKEVTFTTLVNSKGEPGDLKPEIETAQSLKRQFPDRKIKVIVHLYDRSRKRFQEREINYMNPKKTEKFNYFDDDEKQQ